MRTCKLILCPPMTYATRFELPYVMNLKERVIDNFRSCHSVEISAFSDQQSLGQDILLNESNICDSEWSDRFDAVSNGFCHSWDEKLKF